MSWRDRLVPASFRGVEFHIDTSTRSGGRRGMLHEFPKRNTPEWEDLGRRGRGFSLTAYLVGPDYYLDRDELVAALEEEGPGLLVHPTRGEQDVAVVTFNETEVKARGGYVEFDIAFVEAGQAVAFHISENTQTAVESKATEAEQSAVAGVNRGLGEVQPGQADV